MTIPGTPGDPATEARNALLQIITAARMDDMQLAGSLTSEFHSTYGTILPLFISCVSLVETVLNTVGEALEIPSDRLFSGICLGLSVKAIEAQNQREKGD